MEPRIRSLIRCEFLCPSSVSIGASPRLRNRLFGKHGDHLPVKCRKVLWATAGHQILIPYALLIPPVAACVADVVLDGRPACEFTPGNDLRRNQLPWGMTDRRDRLAAAIHLDNHLPHP